MYIVLVTTHQDEVQQKCANLYVCFGRNPVTTEARVHEECPGIHKPHSSWYWGKSAWGVPRHTQASFLLVLRQECMRSAQAYTCLIPIGTEARVHEECPGIHKPHSSWYWGKRVPRHTHASFLFLLRQECMRVPQHTHASFFLVLRQVGMRSAPTYTLLIPLGTEAGKWRGGRWLESFHVIFVI